MANVTIPNLPPGVTPTLSDPFESVQSATSVRQTMAAVRGTAATAVTTGASPVDVNYDAKLVYITTGGTGAEEVINLTIPPFNIGTYYNAENIAQRVTFVLVALTDPGDSVRVTINGSDGAPFFQEALSYYGVYGYDTIILDFLSASVSLVWDGTQFALDLYYAGNNFSGTYDTRDITLTTAVTSPGKKVRLQGGSGGLVFDQGTGPWTIENIPTSDPGVAGQVWSNLGILTISSGSP
jgi:hypothetical protein